MRRTLWFILCLLAVLSSGCTKKWREPFQIRRGTNGFAVQQFREGSIKGYPYSTADPGTITTESFSLAQKSVPRGHARLEANRYMGISDFSVSAGIALKSVEKYNRRVAELESKAGKKPKRLKRVRR